MYSALASTTSRCTWCPKAAAAAHLEEFACCLIVHDVCLAAAVQYVADLLSGGALVQADVRDADGPGRVAYGQLEVHVAGGQVVAVVHVLHHHPQAHLQGEQRHNRGRGGSRGGG